jgi:hypothetical protein
MRRKTLSGRIIAPSYSLLSSRFQDITAHSTSFAVQDLTTIGKVDPFVKTEKWAGVRCVFLSWSLVKHRRRSAVELWATGSMTFTMAEMMLAAARGWIPDWIEWECTNHHSAKLEDRPMSNSQQLYHNVLRRVEQARPSERGTRQRNLALLVTGLYLAARCSLTAIADHLLVSGCKDSRVQRVRRFLMNPRLAVRAWYGPTVRAVLSHLGNALIVLVLDRTTIGKRLNILTVSVAYRGRTLPLAWKVLKKQGQMRRCHVQAALRFVSRWAPATPHIWVVGDREFQDVALQSFIEHDLGWHYVQRITNNLWLYPDQAQPFQPKQLGVQPGDCQLVANVRVTRKQAGPAHFIAYWAKGEDEPWYLLSDLPVGRQTLRIYARRTWVEPMYRDFKSFGWNIEATRISDPQRFARLLLGIALAYVWLIQLASVVIKRGWRRLVDRTARRTLSYFRIGWNWLKRASDHDLSSTLPDKLYL